MLSILVFIAGVALIQFAITSKHGDIIGGWSIEPKQLRVGFTRLLYPFFAGLLLSRVAKPAHVKNAFFWCSLLLAIVLAMPRIGGKEHLWMNGLYDSLSIVFVFPIIVYLGASGEVTGKLASRLSRFLADISYPLYIIHYPFIYMFMAWVLRHKEYLSESSVSIQVVLMALLVLFGSIFLAWVCVKFYDIPVRKWLTKRFMTGTTK